MRISDWSSDVFSSDLIAVPCTGVPGKRAHIRARHSREPLHGMPGSHSAGHVQPEEADIDAEQRCEACLEERAEFQWLIFALKVDRAESESEKQERERIADRPSGDRHHEQPHDVDEGETGKAPCRERVWEYG